MTDDMIERLVEQWSRVRPELDAGPMRISGRLLRLAKLVERRTEAVLKPLGLELWQFDVLATLRRYDRDMSPGELLDATMLTSGAMTYRLDRLEASRLIERRPDPDDRRGVRVRLTAGGAELVDRAVELRFEEAARVATVLREGDSTRLGRLLAELERGLQGLTE
ncbi:MAG: MarR family transcriptional regulator [Gemmatimonadetes bacterium]|nr:MarR family transcriptional regulator [Gemmatimonadota bacterium]